MIWLVIAWIVGAIAFWLFGRSIVGESSAGQRALPLVSAFWPVFTALAMVICLVALIDFIADEGIVAAFGRDDRP